MHGPTARLKKALLVLSAVSLVAMPAAALAARSHVSTTSTSYHPFLVHVDADLPSPRNCGHKDWYAAKSSCSGRSAPSGHSYGFSQKDITVFWCSVAAQADCDEKGVGDVSGRKLPPGRTYSRWMKICANYGGGSCVDWLLGAVVMPNGPFSVVAGTIDRHTVHPDSGNQTRIDTPGGPLHLVVTFKSDQLADRAGNFINYGYSIGLIGSVLY